MLLSIPPTPIIIEKYHADDTKPSRFVSNHQANKVALITN